jgi:predicted DNA-binding transcriptional regulator AlpA
MLLKIRDLCEYVQLSRPSVYRAIKAGKLPPPHKLTPRTARWDLLEVLDYLGRRGL